MAHEQTDFSAERCWLAHPQQFRDAVLDNIWCSRCRGAVRIRDYTVQRKPGGIALIGTCVTCGNEVALYIGDNE